MFKRIKKLFNINEYPKELVNTIHKDIKENSENIGDGKAVFIGSGTQEEYKKQVEEDKGFKGIFGL